MKMPSSKGIITIVGDYKKSSACAVANSRVAESLVIAAEKKILVIAAKETKKIPLEP